MAQMVLKWNTTPSCMNLNFVLITCKKWPIIRKTKATQMHKIADNEILSSQKI